MSLIDLGSITGSYFYMAELFLNNFYNVLGTNRLLFSTRHACLIFPPILPSSLPILSLLLQKKNYYKTGIKRRGFDPWSGRPTGEGNGNPI